MADLKSINPTDGSVLDSVKITTKADLETVLKDAKQGFTKWRQVPIQKRAQTLVKLAGLLKRQAGPLAELITREMGKPIGQATAEVTATAGDLLYNAKAGPKWLANEVLAKKKGLTSVLAYDPVGVVAAIKPWNFPINTPMLSIASALVAGNSVIFKPSEYTSLVGKELTKLIWQAGIPKDVFQVIYGSGRVGAMLVDQPVDMVSFTGSSSVGKEIANKCAARLIKFSLEMGGSTPAIVCRDADLELAAETIVTSRFENCGQVCNAVKRVFVERAVATKLTNLIVKKTKALKVGDPFDKATDVGPLVSVKQLLTFENQITRGVVQGGRILTGGRRIREGQLAGGSFHQLTVMVHVQPRIDIMSEETFGPVLPICDIDNLDQAIRYANLSRYGLTAVGFTSSKVNAQRIASEVVAGGCFINTGVAFYPGSPWTGLKDSGFGTAAGKHGLYEFTHKRHLHFEQV
ncbi:MAG: aldehyde dehydrogenase family protein [Patescibacteria group bacterium]|nr:aldehyde dehydrogenase family protein [Patescibacteria group bacterium]